MKRIIAMLASISIMLSLFVGTCFADSSTSENGKKDISAVAEELKERGFTDEFLNGFLDEELREIHRDTEGYIVYLAEDNEIQTFSNDIPEDQLEFSLSVAYYARQGSANEIDHAVIYCRYEWLSDPDSRLKFYHPAIREIDGITINWGEGFAIRDVGPDFMFRSYKKLNSSPAWTLVDTVKRPGRTNENGLGFTFDLDTSRSYGNRGTASFELYPKDESENFYVPGNGRPSCIAVSGEYDHMRDMNSPASLAESVHGISYLDVLSILVVVLLTAYCISNFLKRKHSFRG